MTGEAGQPLANASLFKHPSHFKVPLETQAPAPVAQPNAAPADHSTDRDAAGPLNAAAAGQQQVAGAQSEPLKLLDGGAAAASGADAAAQLSPTADLERRIADAEEQGGGPMLAPMFLELAVLHANASNEPLRLAALRSAAGFGARFGPRAAHALARLHLAEVCYAAGDLHGACEHWQLARMAYHDDGNKPEFNRVDRMMLSHGCPTDWVLTDF